jgi:hypothetical protein
MADDEVDENAKARRTRSIVIGLILAGFVLLFFVMTIVRLGIRFG